MLNILQAGRALAALAVVLFHLSICMGLARYAGNPVFRDYTRHGDLGVDFFFVISGFIILFAHFKDVGKPAAWSHYIYRRFVRLYPVYWLYTTVFVLLLACGFGTDAKLPANLTDWLNTYSLLRFSPAEPPIGPAWTLFHEVAFYVLFSILILSKRIGTLALLAWGTLCVLLYHFPKLDNRTALVVYTSAYGLYFLFGMAAYWIFRRPGRGITECALGLLAAVTWFALLGTPYEVTKLLVAAGFALILAGAAKMETAGLLASPRLLTYIGNASYSIYLTHEALEGLLLKIALKTGLLQRVGPETTFVMTAVGTVALGCLAYAVVEQPLLAWLRNRKASASRNKAARAEQDADGFGLPIQGSSNRKVAER